LQLLSFTAPQWKLKRKEFLTKFGCMTICFVFCVNRPVAVHFWSVSGYKSPLNKLIWPLWPGMLNLRKSGPAKKDDFRDITAKNIFSNFIGLIPLPLGAVVPNLWKNQTTLNSDPEKAIDPKFCRIEPCQPCP
jgi:hypothetical protein